MKRRVFLLASSFAPALARGADPLAPYITHRPNHPLIRYLGWANVKATYDGATGDRMVIDSPFRADNPCARIQFDTDASEVKLLFRYVLADSIPGRRNWASEGMVVVDDRDSHRLGAQDKHASGVSITRITLGQQGRRLIEFVMPVADNVTFLGIGLPKGAELYDYKRAALKRYVAYGDSITQGFHATNPVNTYPMLLARAKNWELINMGFGSRKITQPDGAVLARLRPDIVTMMIGVNDCLQKKPLDRFAADLRGLITEFRRGAPKTPLFFITPLPVVDSAKWPGSDQLEAYRITARDTLAKLADPNLHIIEGTKLITTDEKLFKDGLHPNADGYLTIAKALGEAVSL